MDQVDYKIIQLLRNNARISFSEIGKMISLSTPAVSIRVQKLQEQGIIKGYTAVLEPEFVQKNISCYCLVILRGGHQLNQEFLRFIDNEKDIIEAYCVSGEYEYLLKIVTHSTKTLEELLNKIRFKVPNTKSKTLVILSCLKAQPFSLT